MQVTLLQARKLSGITQEEFANKMGLSVPTISKFETDSSLMRIAQAKRAASILNVKYDGMTFATTDELLGRTSEEAGA